MGAGASNLLSQISIEKITEDALIELSSDYQGLQAEGNSDEQICVVLRAKYAYLLVVERAAEEPLAEDKADNGITENMVNDSKAEDETTTENNNEDPPAVAEEKTLEIIVGAIDAKTRSKLTAAKIASGKRAGGGTSTSSMNRSAAGRPVSRQEGIIISNLPRYVTPVKERDVINKSLNRWETTNNKPVYPSVRRMSLNMKPSNNRRPSSAAAGRGASSSAEASRPQTPPAIGSYPKPNSKLCLSPGAFADTRKPSYKEDLGKDSSSVGQSPKLKNHDTHDRKDGLVTGSETASLQRNIKSAIGPNNTCLVCKIAFKSADVLERHILYSYLHAQNAHEDGSEEVKAFRMASLIEEGAAKFRKAGARAAAVRIPTTNGVAAMKLRARRRWLWAIRLVLRQNRVNKTKRRLNMADFMTRKIDYVYSSTEHLFSGSKFFWRIHTHLECGFYLHFFVEPQQRGALTEDEKATQLDNLLGPHNDGESSDLREQFTGCPAIIEVISHAGITGDELNRIYLDFFEVLAYLREEIAQSEVLYNRTRAMSKHATTNTSSTTGTGAGKRAENDPLYEAAKRSKIHIISDWILSKLDLDVDTNTVVFLPLAKTASSIAAAASGAATAATATAAASSGTGAAAGTNSNGAGTPGAGHSSSNNNNNGADVNTAVVIRDVQDQLTALSPLKKSRKRRASLNDLTHNYDRLVVDSAILNTDVKRAESRSMAVSASLEELEKIRL